MILKMKAMMLLVILDDALACLAPSAVQSALRLLQQRLQEEALLLCRSHARIFGSGKCTSVVTVHQPKYLSRRLTLVRRDYEDQTKTELSEGKLHENECTTCMYRLQINSPVYDSGDALSEPKCDKRDTAHPTMMMSTPSFTAINCEKWVVSK